MKTILAEERVAQASIGVSGGTEDVPGPEKCDGVGNGSGSLDRSGKVCRPTNLAVNPSKMRDKMIMVIILDVSQIAYKQKNNFVLFV